MLYSCSGLWTRKVSWFPKSNKYANKDDSFILSNALAMVRFFHFGPWFWRACNRLKKLTNFLLLLQRVPRSQVRIIAGDGLQAMVLVSLKKVLCVMIFLKVIVTWIQISSSDSFLSSLYRKHDLTKHLFWKLFYTRRIEWKGLRAPISAWWITQVKGRVAGWGQGDRVGDRLSE